MPKRDAQMEPLPWKGHAARRRPGSETPLAVWMRQSGTSMRRIARLCGVPERTMRLWVDGKVVPPLVGAYRIEAESRGGVPVAAWLGTDLGRYQWLRYLKRKNEEGMG